MALLTNGVVALTAPKLWGSKAVNGGALLEGSQKENGLGSGVGGEGALKVEFAIVAAKKASSSCDGEN